MTESVLAAQLYTVREFMKTPADIAASMKKVKALGYDAVQTSGHGPIAPEEMKRIVDGEGLTICATHISYERMRPVFNLTTRCDAPVHVMDADGGNREGPACPWSVEQPSWSAYAPAPGS